MAWPRNAEGNMSRELVANTEQFSDVARLGVYRAAGLHWNTPFRRLYRLEAETVINIL